MRKFFCLLLILLMFMSVRSCVPVYAKDNEVYTLGPGEVYRFRFKKPIDLVFSDNVLYGKGTSSNNLYTYDSYGNRYNGSPSGVPVYVYNCSYSEINITLNEGEITAADKYYSPFTLVMFDASEEVFEMKNISDVYLRYKVHYYNEDTGSIDFNTGTSLFRGTKTLEGKGVLMFEFTEDDLPYNLELNGAYEVGDYISEDFFPSPPWILRMDLAGMIRVLLDQLSMLLPVALVVLSVFLLVSFLIYMVHLFL